MPRYVKTTNSLISVANVAHLTEACSKSERGPERTAADLVAGRRVGVIAVVVVQALA